MGISIPTFNTTSHTAAFKSLRKDFRASGQALTSKGWQILETEHALLSQGYRSKIGTTATHIQWILGDKLTSTLACKRQTAMKHCSQPSALSPSVIYAQTAMHLHLVCRHQIDMYTTFICLT